MEKDIKVSVIVPVYNTEQYLHRCLKSLLGQTYCNLEIILVDDGSQDRSGELCDAYAAKDHRIRVIHQGNAGQGSARNAGLDAATGDILSFVDSDDYVSACLYETVTEIFEKENADIVCFQLCAGMEENHQFSGNRDSEQKEPVEISGIELLRRLYETEHFDSSVLKVYKKELFETVRFPAERTMGEDAGTVYQLVYRAGKVVLLPQELYYYYQAPGSTMRGKFSLDKVKECDSFKERLQFFDCIGEKKLYERALLQYEAVVLRSYYYVKKLYSAEKELLAKLRGEINFASNAIRKADSISLLKKLVYYAAAVIPKPAGYFISRLM